MTRTDWMTRWNEQGRFDCDVQAAGDGFYLLNMFPYPKGSKHVAQARHFYVIDAYARFLRLRGKNVLSPFGFDAFGLPAEHEARTRGIDPAKWTYDNIELFRNAYRAWGVGYEPGREVVTCEPEYYRWTQWLFIRLLRHGLAYRADAEVWWCPGCTTVLANEQVNDEVCSICSTGAERRRQRQWFLRITDYADQLLDDLDGLDWPQQVKQMQIHWIGRRDGDGAESETRYRIRDWLVSRQRSWGTPIPVIHCAGCGPQPMRDEDLPAPVIEPGAPSSELPCSRCGALSPRDPDTLDTFVDSSWYYLRYLSPHDTDRAFDPELVKRWLPVDLYIGGIAYATSHLIYARFITKALRDMGELALDEPFQRLSTFGLIRTMGVRCATHGWLNPTTVTTEACPQCRTPIIRQLTKMATRRHTNLDVQDLADRYGPDAVRAGVLALGPHEQDLTWSVSGVEGARRWLDRLGRMVREVSERGTGQPGPGPGPTAVKVLSIARETCLTNLTAAFVALHPHLALSHLITFTKAIRDYLRTPGATSTPESAQLLCDTFRDLAIMMTPLVPAVAEDIWAELKITGVLLESGWPSAR